jgi:hypothetical protein
MDPEKLKAAIEALKNGDGDAALAVLEDMLIGASSGEAPPPAEGAALGESADPPPPAPGEEDPEKAAAARLCKITGHTSLEGVAEFVAKAAKRIDEDEQTRGRVERDERRTLVGELVKCGSETPATAWSGKPEDRTPAEPWASLPIVALRERVKRLSKAPAAPPRAPREEVVGGRTVKTSLGDVVLSSREIKNCEELGAKVETYAENKAIRDAAKARATGVQ